MIPPGRELTTHPPCLRYALSPMYNIIETYQIEGQGGSYKPLVQIRGAARPPLKWKVVLTMVHVCIVDVVP